MLRLLDLFSGIGGFSLGLERSGFFKTVAFCEIEPFPRRVLKKHWPDVPIYEDVRTLTAARLAADGIINTEVADSDSIGRLGVRVGPQWNCREAQSRFGYGGASGIDAICGGFPCQDISVAGKGAGIEGARSGLWSEYARIIGELRPRVVIVENVAALLGRGLERVLGDLAALGFDAEWHCIPASAVGAPHRRDRLWLVAYPKGAGEAKWKKNDVSDAGSPHVEGQWLAQRIQAERGSFGGSSWWLSEPDVGRVANGVPSRVDRLKGLGNAVIPQIPELIGRAIGTALLETA